MPSMSSDGTFWNIKCPTFAQTSVFWPDHRPQTEWSTFYRHDFPCESNLEHGLHFQSKFVLR